MLVLAESLFCFIAFYLIGSIELRGRAETRQCALSLRTNCALIATIILNLIIAYDPFDFFAGDNYTLFLVYIPLTALLAVITLLDIETKMLSDALTVILGIGGLAYTWMVSESVELMVPSWGLGIGLGLLGAFLAGPYSKWRKQEMLGWGDVKFFAAAGLWLVPLQLPLFLAGAGLIGTINAVIYRVATGQAQTPFAPALCAALWLCVVYGLSL